MFIVYMIHSNFYMCGLQNISHHQLWPIAKNLDTHLVKLLYGAYLRQIYN